MANGFAQITLIGNLGREPEMSYTQDGTAVTKMSLAVTTRQGGKDVTSWYALSAWRGLAETLNKYARKGQELFIQGDFSPRPYTTKDGKAAISLDVNVTSFKFLGSRQNGGGAAPGDYSEGDSF